jgi:CRP-like cAMP-binding protein
MRVLRSVPAFAALPAAALEDLSRRFIEVPVPAGAVVVTEGDRADALYVVQEGEATVSMAGPQGPVPLGLLADGDLFGEMGLLSGALRRTASVKACTPLLLLRLSHAAFRQASETRPELRQALSAMADALSVASLISLASPFRKLDRDERLWMAEHLERRAVAEGEAIFRQGEPGDACFLLRSGRVALLRREGGEESCLAILEPGAVFGEAALLTSAPRRATARAVEESRLLALRREELMDVMTTQPATGHAVVEEMRRFERPLRADDVLVRTRTTPEGETLTVLERPPHDYYRLSALGAFVWERLDGRRSLAEIAEEHERERGAVARGDVFDIVAGLVSAKFAFAEPLREDVRQAVRAPSLRERLKGALRAVVGRLR